MSFIEVSLTEQYTLENFSFFLREFGFRVAKDYENLDRCFRLFYPESMSKEDALYWINKCESVEQAADGDDPVYHCAIYPSDGFIDKLAKGDLDPVYTMNGYSRHVDWDPELQPAHWGLVRTMELDNPFPRNGVVDLPVKVMQRTGNGVVYYVVDSGVDWDHPDFKLSDGRTKVLEGDDTQFGKGIDDNSHGTHCSSSGAGLIYGPAKDSPVVWGKGLSSTGAGTLTTLTNTINNIITYHNANFANVPAVCNMSWGGPTFSYSTQTTALANAGIIPMCARGNSFSAGNFYPSTDPHTMAVSATDMDDTHCSFTNYGTYTDINAPGRDILAATRGFTMDWYNGTSMATGFLSGVVACLLQGYKAPANATEVDAVIAAILAAMPESCPGGKSVGEGDTGDTTTKRFSLLTEEGVALPLESMVWPYNALIAPSSVCECVTSYGVRPQASDLGDKEFVYDNIAVKPEDWIPLDTEVATWMHDWTDPATWSTGIGDDVTTAYMGNSNPSALQKPRIYTMAEMQNPSGGSEFEEQPFSPNGYQFNGPNGTFGGWYQDIPIEVLAGSRMWDVPVVNRKFTSNGTGWTYSGTGSADYTDNDQSWYPVVGGDYFRVLGGQGSISQVVELTDPDLLDLLATGNALAMLGYWFGSNYASVGNDTVQFTVEAFNASDVSLGIVHQSAAEYWNATCWSPKLYSGIAIPAGTVKLKFIVANQLLAGSNCNGLFDGFQMRIYEPNADAEALCDAGKLSIRGYIQHRSFEATDGDVGYMKVEAWDTRSMSGVPPTLSATEERTDLCPGNWTKRAYEVAVPPTSRMVRFRPYAVRNAGTQANFHWCELTALSVVAVDEHALDSVCECESTMPDFLEPEVGSVQSNNCIGS